MAGPSGLDLARLAIVFSDNSPATVVSMRQVVLASRNVGATIDQQTAKTRENTKATQDALAAMNQMNQAHAAAASGLKRGSNDVAAYTRTVQDMKRALDEEAKAAASVASGHQLRAAAIGRLMASSRQDYQQGAISVQQYSQRLSQLQVEMNKVAAPQQQMATHGKEAANSMALLSGAMGGFFGVLGFQALSGLTQFTSFLASMPGDLAHAGDEFERLNARITFAFRGSTEAARAARQDMISIARDTGTPLSQVSQSYGDLAIAGRGPGLSRGQIGGLVKGFSTLGVMTGADNASTGRAMWQFQQALSLGRLTSQDYRFMATNMPAIDDALAAGMGVDVNRIPQMISRGEISAERMVDALAKGVEVLRRSAGGLPETMERARGRIQTEWELMFTNLEARIKSSDFYQGVMGGISGAMMRSNINESGTTEDRLRLARGDLAGIRIARPNEFMSAERGETALNWQNIGRSGSWESSSGQPIIVTRELYERTQARVRQLEEQQEREARDPALRRARDAEEAREAGVDRRAAINLGYSAVQDLDPIQAQRGAQNQFTEQLRAALAQRDALAPAQVQRMQEQDAELARQQGQLQRQGYREDSPEVGRLTTDRQALQEQIRGASALGTDQVREMERALAGAEGQLNSLMYAYQRMQVQAGLAARDLTRYGAGGGFDIAQSARSIIEQALSQNVQLDMGTARGIVLDQRMIGAGNELGTSAEEFRRRQIVVDAAGLDVAARRRAQLNAQEDEYRSKFGRREDMAPDQAARVDTLASEFRRQREAGFGQEDQQSLAERKRADRERLDAMRLQLAMGIQLGQQGRIALAQAQGELELRRQFPNITQAQIDAEKQRVAENVRVAEALQLQQEQMALLQDAAETAGSAIGDAFRTSIIDGVRSGTLRAETFFNALENSALRIADNIMKAFLAPYEQQATNWISSIARSMGLPGMTKSANGNVFDSSGLVPFANGGIVTRPTIFPFANGIGLMGEAGAEAILPLKRGSDGKLGVANQGSGGGGSNVSVVINDMRSGSAAPVQQQESRGPNGERIIEVMIQDAMDKNVRSGNLNSAMRSQFGASPVITRD